MRGYNKVILIGNLTRDPELRYTPKGTAVAKIGLAVGRVWRDESGAQKEETTFVDIDAWGKQAETISQYLKKGRPILVEGRLKLDTWDDKQTNQKRSKLGVVLEAFQFLDSGANREGGSAGGFASEGPPDANRAQRPAAARPAAAAPPPTAEGDMPPDAEDDVPF
jgi:single-strand DNA-binding protein